MENGEFSFEDTKIKHKSDLKWIEGNKEYCSTLRFVFNFKNGNKFVWYMDESNVKVDSICEVNIQQKEEMKAAYEIIKRWMALGLGFFISIFCGFFGLVFEEGSKGYL